jgi:leucyl-tRNA synthetase
MWPEYDEAFITEQTMAIVVQINGKLRTQLVVATDATEEQILALVKEDPKIVTSLDGKQLKRHIYVPGKLINLVV